MGSSTNAWSNYMLERLGAHEFVDQLSQLPRYGPPAADEDGLADVAFVQGAALFLRVGMLPSIGLFEESFFCFYEEVDLCRRARWAGYRVCLAVGLGIEHVGGAATKADETRLRLMIRNRYYYALTDPRLHGPVPHTLLGRFAGEDLTLTRNRRLAGLIAFLRAWAWLLARPSKILALRAASSALCGPNRSHSVSP